MLRFCRAMHSVSILHMDIKPDNWLLTHRPADELSHTEEERQPRSIAHSISLIDFGRAIDLSMFPHNGSGMAFMGKCCPSRFSCPAMTEVSAWKALCLSNYHRHTRRWAGGVLHPTRDCSAMQKKGNIVVEEYCSCDFRQLRKTLTTDGLAPSDVFTTPICSIDCIWR